MKKVVKFKANDGTVFDAEKECRKHEKLLLDLELMFHPLDTAPDTSKFINGHGYLQHDPGVFKRLCEAFYKLACEHMPSIKKNGFPMGSYGFWRTLDDNGSVLYRWGQRILNTDPKTSREYGQPYYAQQPWNVKGGCLNP